MIGKEEARAIQRVMRRGELSAYQGNGSSNFFGGPEIRALEKEWSEYFNVQYAIACNSATSGLWMSCAAIGLKPGDEVIVSPYSMACSASMPLNFGAKPVFADIERDYYCLDPNAVEKAITARTKAIIVVDLFGQPYAADEINKIAIEHDLMVIEDTSQAIGARYKGTYAGTLGDIGVFSLNRHKHIHCGEGGVVVTDDYELSMKLRLAMNHAEAVVNDVCENKIEENSFHRAMVGMNMRMTEMQAAIAREQLKKLNKILIDARSCAKYFPINIRPGCDHAFYRYAYLGEEINVVPNAFSSASIVPVSKRHYVTPLFKLPLFKNLGYDQDQCPVCQKVEEVIVLAWRSM